ncbi:hypothetical protein FRC17_008108 [Serendipita sp. 399]|nr:hypothetical protein FRC17_008108 [Serendipita sp. 399]
MATYSVTPLVAVGFEGLFGLLTLILVSPILIHYKSKSDFFDLPRGLHQMINNPLVLGSAFAIATSIGFYNFFGMSVTRHISATMRSIIDTCRTITIWLVSLGLGLISPPPFLKAPATVEYTALPTDDDEDGHARGTVIEDREAVAGRSLDQTAALPADVGMGFDVIPPPVPKVDPERRD